MKVTLKNVRLSFHDLFDAKSIKGSAKKYSATFIITPESKARYTSPDGQVKEVPLAVDESGDRPTSIIHKIIAKVAKDKFGELKDGEKRKVKIWCLNKADGSTTRDEAQNKEGEYWDGIDENTWLIDAAKREDKAPDGKMVVLNQLREPIGSGSIYSGCYVNAIIDVYAGDNDGRVVCASLEGVQLKKKGESLGSQRIDAKSEFEDEEMPEDEGDIDSTAGDAVENDPGF